MISRMLYLGVCLVMCLTVAWCSTRGPDNSKEDTSADTALTVTDTSKEALNYNDALISIHAEVVDAYNTYITSLGSGSANITQIQTNLNNIMSIVQTAIKKVNLMSDFKGDNTFLEGTKTYFEGIKSIISNEETAFVKMITDGTWSLDSTGYTTLEQTIQLKLETIDQAYKKIQEAFAKKYKFDLADTMLTWALSTGTWNW